MTTSSTGTLGDGVYYEREAYAGLLRRFAILLVDLATLFAIGLFLGVLWFGVFAEFGDPGSGFLWSWIGLGYVYLVFLEASPIGTLGFFLAGVKIVNLKGERPSFLRMTLRLLMWFLGPFNPLIDLIWLGGDDDRQTLRDKFAGTYVVKKGALPAGHGPVGVAYYNLLGFTIAFPEVKKHVRA